MKNNFSLLLTLLLASSSFAQTGIGTTAPSANAMLDITSTQKGLLLPRLNAAQLSTLSATLTSEQKGMIVTDAATGRPITWTGAAWQAVNTITASSPLTVTSTNTLAINPGTAAGDLITWDGSNWINIQPAVQPHFSSTADNRQPYLTLSYCMAMTGIFPSPNSDQPYLSEIQLFSFSFVPKNWAFCNGQLLPISQNQALFALLGVIYGGDGRTTFALPNLQGRVALDYGSGAGLTPYLIGNTGGSESNTITH